jgi:hypothetical protein
MGKADKRCSGQHQRKPGCSHSGFTVVKDAGDVTAKRLKIGIKRKFKFLEIMDLK